MYYCPKCQLPYRAVIPYVKHLKKHLIAVVRYNGVRDHGTNYDFSKEVYDDTGSLQCPVTDCRQVFSKELIMIKHMEDHLEKMGEIAGFRTNYDDFVPVKGRPPTSGKETGQGVTTDGSPDHPSQADSLVPPALEETLRQERDRSPLAAEAGQGGDRAATTPVGGASVDQRVQYRQSLCCYECERVFAKPSVALNHQHEKHLAVITTCAFCFRRMENTLDLIEHVAETHDHPPPSVNGSTGVPKSGVKRKLDTKDLNLRCDKCDIDFTLYKELLKHQHYVHATTDKRCRLCSKGINSYPSLIGHVNSCDGTLP